MGVVRSTVGPRLVTCCRYRKHVSDFSNNRVGGTMGQSKGNTKLTVPACHRNVSQCVEAKECNG